MKGCRERSPITTYRCASMDTRWSKEELRKRSGGRTTNTTKLLLNALHLRFFSSISYVKRPVFCSVTTLLHSDSSCCLSTGRAQKSVEQELHEVPRLVYWLASGRTDGESYCTGLSLWNCYSPSGWKCFHKPIKFIKGLFNGVINQGVINTAPRVKELLSSDTHGAATDWAKSA